MIKGSSSETASTEPGMHEEGVGGGYAETAELPVFDEKPSVLQKLQKWGDYDAFGEPVAPTRFLPMKTPLGRKIIDNWDDEQPPRAPLTLDILMQAQTLKGRKVGMILDLSNHETLYAADLKTYDVQYERVPLVAKILPTQQAINKVIAVADRFWSDHPEQYIAMHCAYGFNRTGFVLCSYLVQACHLSVQEALDNFAVARPPGVRHEQFVEELHKRYDGHMNQALPRAQSFSDLRGYTRQTVGSLHSEFGGVAEHLHHSNPGLNGRSSLPSSARVSTEIMGCSPSTSYRNSPPLKASLNHPHSMSGKSIDAPLSNCESVNNESLDLDEKDIFRHFVSRSTSDGMGKANKPGRHGRGRLSGLSHPASVLGEESDSSSLSSSPTKRLQRSPFSTVQDSDEMQQMIKSTETLSPPCAMQTDSSMSGTTAFAMGDSRAQAGTSESSEVQCPPPGVVGGGTASQARPPLYPSPAAARVSAKKLGDCSSRIESCQPPGSLAKQERQHRPCYIM